MSTYRNRRSAPPPVPELDPEAGRPQEPPPKQPPRAVVPSIAALGGMPAAASASDIRRYQALLAAPPTQLRIASDEAWITQYRDQRATRRKKKKSSAAPPVDLALVTPAAQQARNTLLATICRAKNSNHMRRKNALDHITPSNANAQEPVATAALAAAVERDQHHGHQIDRLLWGAVLRRRDRVESLSMFAESQEEQPCIETDKGAWLVYPRGTDPHDPQTQMGWMYAGFALKQANVRSPLVDFQITWSDMAQMDRTWMRYIIRRICRAIGRDPDRDVLAASHEPDIHGPSTKDGKPIQPHAHVAVRTCNPDGSVWRCQNLHLVVQRELEAINAQRGWEALSTAAVAKGRQQHWYTPRGEHKIGWTTITHQARVFTQTDDPAQVLAVAQEPFPAHAWSRPGAGIIVFNAQGSETRTKLRQQDLRRLARAERELNEAMSAVCDVAPDILNHIVGGCVQLAYFARPSSPQAAAAYQRLVDAVLRRDDAAITYYAGRLRYFSEAAA